MQWDQAIHLAAKLAPQEVTIISREYARQLEIEGKFSEALKFYEAALQTSSMFDGDEDDKIEHQVACSSGLTRMTFQMADIGKGMKLLVDCQDKDLLSDCAVILQGLKQYSEAGSLFEKAEKWDKAAEMFIRARMWGRVSSVIAKVKDLKVFQLFARAQEGHLFYD
jgi:WD repeat-containing protein 19